MAPVMSGPQRTAASGGMVCGTSRPVAAVAEGRESPTPPLGQHAALGLSRRQQLGTFIEHTPSVWPWGQGPGYSILHASVSPLQEGRWQQSGPPTDEADACRHLEVMIHAGKERHQGLAGLGTLRQHPGA